MPVHLHGATHPKSPLSVILDVSTKDVVAQTTFGNKSARDFQDRVGIEAFELDLTFELIDCQQIET